MSRLASDYDARDLERVSQGPSQAKKLYENAGQTADYSSEKEVMAYTTEADPIVVAGDPGSYRDECAKRVENLRSTIDFHEDKLRLCRHELNMHMAALKAYDSDCEVPTARDYGEGLVRG